MLTPHKLNKNKQEASGLNNSWLHKGLHNLAVWGRGKWEWWKVSLLKKKKKKKSLLEYNIKMPGG